MRTPLKKPFPLVLVVGLSFLLIGCYRSEEEAAQDLSDLKLAYSLFGVFVLLMASMGIVWAVRSGRRSTGIPLLAVQGLLTIPVVSVVIFYPLPGILGIALGLAFMAFILTRNRKPTVTFRGLVAVVSAALFVSGCYLVVVHGLHDLTVLAGVEKGNTQAFESRYRSLAWRSTAVNIVGLLLASSTLAFMAMAMRKRRPKENRR